MRMCGAVACYEPPAALGGPDGGSDPAADAVDGAAGGVGEDGVAVNNWTSAAGAVAAVAQDSSSEEEEFVPTVDMGIMMPPSMYRRPPPQQQQQQQGPGFPRGPVPLPPMPIVPEVGRR